MLVDGRLFSLIREGNQYVAGLDVIRELFDQPDFAIVWSMPIPESQRAEESITLAWPEISDRIQWIERLLIPLDVTPRNGQYDSNRYRLFRHGSKIPAQWDSARTLPHRT